MKVGIEAIVLRVADNHPMLWDAILPSEFVAGVGRRANVRTAGGANSHSSIVVTRLSHHVTGSDRDSTGPIAADWI
jgi:hypothetical protein